MSVILLGEDLDLMTVLHRPARDVDPTLVFDKKYSH
jgi:hypothetical protein